MKILLSILNLVLIFTISFGQSIKIDSLISVTEKTNNDINKITALFELSKIYKYDSTDIAEKYAIEALNIAEKINNDSLIVNSINGLNPIRLLKNDLDDILSLYNKALLVSERSGFIKGTGVTYNNIGSYYNKINNLDTAVYFYLKAGKIFEDLKLFKIAASTYNNAGIVYYKQANYENAINFFIKSLEIKETILPNGSRVATDGELAASMVNIGLFYYKLKNYKESLTYLKNANINANKANNTNYMCIAQSNIGVIFNTIEKYDSALYYFNTALILAEKMNSIQRKSIIYTGLGNTHTNLKNYDKAIMYYESSLYYHKKTKNYRDIAIVEKGLTELYYKKNEFDIAKQHGENAFTSAKQTKNTDALLRVSQILSEIYKQTNDYKLAFKYSQFYNQLNDSISSINRENIIAEIQTKYETEKKEGQIKELKIKDIENENAKLTYLIIAGFLLFVSLIMIFFFRQKYKSNKLLNSKNQELKQLNATQNRLMSIISHDFKAPLSAFYSITSSLKNKFNIIEKTDIDEYLNRMQNSALGLKMQLENMLNWSISQSTKINVSTSNVNLSVLVYKTTIILEEFAREKSISINSDIDDNIEITTDARLLSIVLNNLITNAIKFSNTNSVVKLVAEKINNKIQISVKDTGIGISENDLKTLFLGQENKPEHENKGTGLGLIVSKDIIEKLGGKIWAESKLNIGTTFFIELIIND